VSASRIFGDWGSTRLRLWRVADGEPGERREGPGIVGLDRPPAEILRETIAPWLTGGPPAGIRLCGMVGARGGLHEVPYAPCPIGVAEWRQTAVELACEGLPLRIAAGLVSEVEPGRRELMRGEETQVFGALRLRPELAEGRRTIVHPGTHSKWVFLEDGRITGFRTFLTGELFAVLQRSSLLTVAGEGEGSEEEGFAEGLAVAFEDRGLLGDLFQTRAGQVRAGRSHAWASGFLSALLVGSEVTEQRRAGPLEGPLVLIGDPELTGRYARALTSCDVSSETIDGEDCVFAGLELLDADD
jgi:2-dehydro-3-deoxygalactonokinase